MTKPEIVTLKQTHPQGLALCLPGRGHVAPGETVDVPATEAEALIEGGYFAQVEARKARTTKKKNTQTETER